MPSAGANVPIRAGGRLWSDDAEAPHRGDQRGAFEAKPRGRAAGAANHPPGLLERAQDVVAFGVLERHRRGVGGAGDSNSERGTVSIDPSTG